MSKYLIDWKTLHDAYGNAEEVSLLIENLKTSPDSDEIWYSLWSRLYHQGDIYPASFAVTPYIVDIIIEEGQTNFNFFLLPLSIELEQQKKQIEVPTEIMENHRNALNRLTKFVSTINTTTFSNETNRCIKALIALSQNKAEEALKIIGSNPH